MGRNGKPVDLIVQEGKTHITKAEIELRKQSEIRLGTPGAFICPGYVQQDEIAYQKWLEVTELFQGIEFVTNADSGIIARYCKTFSEYQGLLSLLEEAATTSQTLAINKAINQKLSILGSMDDRLFLSPISRIKSLPKKPEPEIEDPNRHFFGD